MILIIEERVKLIYLEPPPPKPPLFPILGQWNGCPDSSDKGERQTPKTSVKKSLKIPMRRKPGWVGQIGPFPWKNANYKKIAKTHIKALGIDLSYAHTHNNGILANATEFVHKCEII